MELMAKAQHYINRYFYNRNYRLLPDIVQSEGSGACGQDIFVAELLGNKRNGVFFDIGANDGFHISNSLYFEKHLGWSGVAVEPIPGIFEKLASNRSCHLVNGCVAPTAGHAQFVELVGGPNMLSTLKENNRGLMGRRIRKNLQRSNAQLRTIEVECFTFSDLARRFGIREIDFLSVDTEGGELAILKSIDFDEHPVSVISVENCYYTNAIREHLEANGFILVGTFKIDEIYLFGGRALRKSLAARRA